MLSQPLKKTTSRESEIRTTMAALKDKFLHYLSTAEISCKNDSLTPLEIRNKDDFLNNNKRTKDTLTYNEFYQTLTDILIDVQFTDIPTIATDNESQNIKRFFQCYDLLNNVGFHGVNNKPLVFWTGWAAQEKVKQPEFKQYSDSDIPAVTILYKLDAMITAEESRTQKYNLKNILGKLNTAYFASKASGVVDVYISTNKVDSEKSGIIIGSYFWNEELYLLQRKHLKGEIQKIRLYLCKYPNQWIGPLDINDSESSSHLLVTRRMAYTNPLYPKLMDLNPERFEKDVRIAADNEKYLGWIKTGARPQILSLLDLRNTIVYWMIKSPEVLNERWSKECLDIILKLDELLKYNKTTSKELAHLFLDSKIDIDERDRFGSTPLIYSSFVGNIRLARALLEAKADVNEKNSSDATPLLTAVHEDHPASVALLLDSKATINNKGDGSIASLIWAAKNPESITTSLIAKELEKEIPRDIDQRDDLGNTALHCACSRGNLALVKSLIKQRASCVLKNEYGHAAIHFAAMSGNADVVEFILSLINPDDLYQEGQYSNLPLHLACKSGDSRSIEVIARKMQKKYLNMKGQSDRTTLYLACESGSLDGVRTLFNLLTDDELLDQLTSPRHSHNLLYAATISGNVELVKFLESKGAIYKGPYANDYASSLLNQAIKSRQRDMIIYILTQHNNITRKFLDSADPLESAIRFGKLTIVKLLVEYGVDLTRTDDHGKRFLKIAEDFGYDDIAVFLREKMGLSNCTIKSTASADLSIHNRLEAFNNEDLHTVDPDNNRCCIL